jgi:DNA-directed RNA polymerase subunit RPC12/RpoP
MAKMRAAFSKVITWRCTACLETTDKFGNVTPIECDECGAKTFEMASQKRLNLGTTQRRLE